MDPTKPLRFRTYQTSPIIPGKGGAMSDYCKDTSHTWLGTVCRNCAKPIPSLDDFPGHPHWPKCQEAEAKIKALEASFSGAWMKKYLIQCFVSGIMAAILIIGFVLFVELVF